MHATRSRSRLLNHTRLVRSRLVIVLAIAVVAVVLARVLALDAEMITAIAALVSAGAQAAPPPQRRRDHDQ